MPQHTCPNKPENGELDLAKSLEWGIKKSLALFCFFLLFPLLLYPNQLKNWELDSAKAPGFNPLELSLESTTDSSAWMSVCGENRPILLVIGTRPEAIKVIPVYEALRREHFPVRLCTTGQHIEMVNSLCSLFGVEPDFAFDIMKPGQDLAYVTESILNKMTRLLKTLNPSLVAVQGDTNSAMTAALAAFYCKVPIAHIEAGLRTYNLRAPFPEELNRQLISRMASLHFAPTALAVEHLRAEGIADSLIFETGNTVVDALYLIKERMERGEICPSPKIQETVDRLQNEGQSLFLLTAHRRESLESGLEEALGAIAAFLREHPEITLLYPVHPNPLIRIILEKSQLHLLPNVLLFPPLPYPDLVYLLLHCRGVLTDSGGIQEEAVSLKRPTLVLRNETDRPEGLQGGIASLVGTNPLQIRRGMQDILDRTEGGLHGDTPSPYGDGRASERIVQAIRDFLHRSVNEEP